MGAWRGDAKLMAKRAEKARAKAKAAEEKAAAREAAMKARKEQKEQAKLKSEAVKSKMRGLLGSAKKDSDAEENGGGGKRRASTSGGGGSLLDRLKAAKMMSTKADDGGGEGPKGEAPAAEGIKEVIVDHWLQATAEGEKAAEGSSQGGLLGLLKAAKPPQTSDPALGHEILDAT